MPAVGNVITGSGTVPSGGTTNQVLQKNTATNYDVGWVSLSAGGNVSNSGTPTAGQDCQWVSATTIKGVTYANFNTVNLGAYTTTSLTGIMAGLAALITPTATGKLNITIYGTGRNDTASQGALLQMRYGTGTAPANGAAPTVGTAMGSLCNIGLAGNPANMRVPFSMTAIVTGLALNTAVWMDISLAVTPSSGTVTLSNIGVAVNEIP
jgi:hypothetical protein